MKTAHCPACLLRLEVGDDLVECPCCDSLLRLARWEPPAFEVVRVGNVIETLAEKDDRIRYEGEMAKIITFREQDSRRTRVIEIDISAASRGLRGIRRMDYLPIFCSFALVGLVVPLVFIPDFRNGAYLANTLIIGTILCLGICVGYMHIGVIDERAWGYYLLLLPLLLLIDVFAIIGLFFITTGAIVSKVEEISLEVAIFQLVYYYFWGLLIVAGFISVLRLRKLRLSSLGLSLIELLPELRSQGENLPSRSKSARSLNAPPGVFLAAAGIIIILACALIPGLLINRQLLELDLAFFLPQVIGWALLMRSRRYFQVDADSLLSVDKRSPILFLRPFSDDQKLKIIEPTMKLIQKYLDFSLETRLSNHFKRFGPFIAVGVPGETVPVPGAARAILSNRKWLPKVADWMNEASVIVMYAGWTNWVSWELAKIIETDSINKLILIIPEVVGEARAVRAENISLRIERLNQVLKGTRWNNSLTKLHNIEDVRAMMLRDDGSVVVVRSRPHNRDSYHLAALIAHYIMLNQAALSSLLNEAGARSSIAHISQPKDAER